MPFHIPASSYELVDIQRGVISRQQALAYGLRAETIDRLVRSGRWQQMRLGVYAVFTGAVSREATLWVSLCCEREPVLRSATRRPRNCLR